MRWKSLAASVLLFTGLLFGTALAAPQRGTRATLLVGALQVNNNALIQGVIKAGTGPTTLTDAAGKLLTASMNTVGVAQGGTGLTTLTTHAVYVGNGTSAPTALTVGAAGTLLAGAASANPAFTATPTLGIDGTTLGTLALAGNTGGTVTIQPQASFTSYNFNLPTAAGTAGQPLLSGGGSGAAQTYGTLSVGGGGTGAATLTGIVSGNGTSAFTATLTPTVTSITGKIIHAEDALQTLAGAAPLVLTAGKDTFPVVGSGGAVTGVTVPTGSAGLEITLMGTHATSTVTLTVNGSSNIYAKNGTTTRVLGLGDSLRLEWSVANTKWHEIAYTSSNQ